METRMSIKSDGWQISSTCWQKANSIIVLITITMTKRLIIPTGHTQLVCSHRCEQFSGDRRFFSLCSVISVRRASFLNVSVWERTSTQIDDIARTLMFFSPSLSHWSSEEWQLLDKWLSKRTFFLIDNALVVKDYHSRLSTVRRTSLIRVSDINNDMHWQTCMSSDWAVKGTTLLEGQRNRERRVSYLFGICSTCRSGSCIRGKCWWGCIPSANDVNMKIRCGKSKPLQLSRRRETSRDNFCEEEMIFFRFLDNKKSNLKLSFFSFLFACSQFIYFRSRLFDCSATATNEKPLQVHKYDGQRKFWWNSAKNFHRQLNLLVFCIEKFPMSKSRLEQS